ncbi:MAG: V-type ATPase 116kDa subunit family protein [Sphaerospermopsis sp. SIO1G2]|nr:V-type ATPase 116kDa subunit family protein [Sphaerospermopsis sp. SIO1G2]
MNNNTPPSQMIRVPTVLIPIVRQLSHIHRQGHTTELLQALQTVIAQFDSSVELPVTELQQVEEKLEELETHLSQQDELLVNKLEIVAKHLEKIERTVASGRQSNSRPRRGYPYQYQQAVEIKSFAPENLAMRLGVIPQSLMKEWETRSEKEFISWSRNRDPSGLGWKFNSKDGLFYPVKQ